jgi:hypothetical protein
MAVNVEKGNVYMELVGKCVCVCVCGGNVIVIVEKGNVYMELVAKCVLGMWQLLWRRKMYKGS